MEFEIEATHFNNGDGNRQMRFQVIDHDDSDS